MQHICNLTNKTTILCNVISLILIISQEIFVSAVRGQEINEVRKIVKIDLEFPLGYWWYIVPTTVAARSKAWTMFACLNSGDAGSNPTEVMDVCVRLFCVCVVICVDSGFVTGWSPVQGVLPTVYRIKKLNKRPRSNKRTVEPYVDRWYIVVEEWGGQEFWMTHSSMTLIQSFLELRSLKCN
jgi:hypothetical protein